MKQVVRNVLNAPLSALRHFWETLWSPSGLVIAVIVWLFLGRPVPRFDWVALDRFRRADLTWVVPYLQWGIPLVVAAFVALKISKWWIHRPPRVKYVEKEKIVYREKVASQQSDLTERMLTKYEGTQGRAGRLPLDEDEREELQRRAKARLLREFEREEGLEE